MLEIVIVASALAALCLVLRRRVRKQAGSPPPETTYVCPHCGEDGCICHKLED